MSFPVSPTSAAGSASFGSVNHQQQQQTVGGGANNNNNGAASASYRSKFAGMPGSASALHVHYGFKHSAPAFDPLPSEHPAAIARREARSWAQGSRLGKQPEWNNNTCTTDSGGHPRRALMHQLSEFQAPKIVHNFRAQEIPSVHKQAVPVWKSGKFKVDQTNFLTNKERTIAGHQVLGNTNVLSHAEMPITEDPEKQYREGGWNNSTALAHERASLFVKRDEADYRALNRMKPILDHDRYVNPIEDVKRKNEQKRQDKREDRARQEEFISQMKRDARARRGLKPASLSSGNNRSLPGAPQQQQQQVFKMSNIDSWWHASPPEVIEAVSVLGERRQAEEEERLRREKAEEEAARMNQPTSLRVVPPGTSSGQQPQGVSGEQSNVSGQTSGR